MATNKKAAKKAAPAKAAKSGKQVSKKVAKPSKSAPKKVAKAAKPAKTAKPVAKKPAAKPAPKVEAKKAAPAPAKKAVAPVKAAPAKKAVKPTAPAAEVKAPVTAKPVKAAAKAEESKPAKPVVIPKLSTSTARKYEPEFTQSVLDKPVAQQNGPIMRYSDAELLEFKDLIQRKLEAAKKELNYLQGLITRKDDMGGDESENRYMTMEDGSISMEREQLSQMASRQIQYIDHLEKAMMRIENKTYGICRVTGKLIDKARLRAVPHATLSIEAKMGYAKNPNVQ
ncbi:MAG: TraR/DksA family transcriptional regulator [Chitinophagaceae bacterium]|nr:TraR/DksA family transcriptional regulator [Chitinophagaceae bacterium]